jgi:hypothetical protein
MKRNSMLKGLLLASCVWGLLINSAQAKSLSDQLTFQPYLGGEYQYTNLQARGSYHNLFSSSYESAALFAGVRFHKYFGIEVGAYRSLKLSSNTFTFYSFNNINNNGGTTTVATQRFKGFSFDLNAYYALDPKFDVCAILGLMTMHPTLYINAWGAGSLAQALPLITAQNKTVPRLGIGFEYSEANWGARMRAIWLYTQRMTVNVTNAQRYFPALDSRAYMQAVQVSAGLFYKF